MTDLSTLSVSDLSELLVLASSKEVDEFNTIYAALEESELENQALRTQVLKVTTERDESRGESEAIHLQLKEVNTATDTIMSNAQKHLDSAIQAKREKEQAIARVTKLDLLMGQYKVLGTPKKIRDQIKSYKIKAIESLRVINLGKTAVKDYRKEIDGLVKRATERETELQVHTMTTVYSNGNDNLMVFPARLTMAIRGVVEKQTTLLCMHKDGTGKLIALDSDNEAVLCQVPKGGFKPKKSTMDVAGDLLRKFKLQGGNVNIDDLDMESMGVQSGN